MQRWLRFRLLWATLFGLAAAGLLLIYLRQLPVKVTEAPPVPVVIAAHSVEKGTLLTPEMLTVVDWPASATLPGALDSAAAAAGKLVTVPLAAGQPVLAHQLKVQEHVGHGGEVPLGMRLLTISVDERLSIGYRLRQGDKVDIISVYKDSKGLHAELILQAIEVYALGEEDTAQTGRGTEPRTVTLILSPDDALMVSVLAEEKSVRIALRATGDTELPAPKPVVKLRQ